MQSPVDVSSEEVPACCKDGSLQEGLPSSTNQIFLGNVFHNFKSNFKRTLTSGETQRELAPEILKVRRQIIISSIAGVLGVNFFMFLRFFFPRVLYEPSTVFKVGYPSDFGFGVDSRFIQEARIWMVRDAEGLFAIFARCTHLGCTPNWMPSENKFKCPCHGSGYDSEGINFEGPAPRPMDRAHIALLPTGEVQVDTSILYQYGHWDQPGAILIGI